MKCICGVIPPTVIRIERIEQEVAKLHKAVVDGIYDSRSIVGDAVLVIEGQVKQLREILDVKLEFNDIHPELKAGEVFLHNVTPGTSDWTRIHYKTKRLGKQAYNLYGKALEHNSKPVFVKEEELRAEASKRDGG
jgi:uncharacterized protein (UPF0335 family)